MNHPKPSLLLTIWLTVTGLLAGCGLSTPSPTAATPIPYNADPRVVIIDTDMAADDWMAILYLLQRPDVRVAAITVTGAGEAHCAQGVQHALGLVALSRSEAVPVACGRETPLQGDHAFPASWRESVDSLLGLTLPAGEDSVSDQTAVELLVSVIRSSPEPITALTLGPLTNVAEAFQGDPALADRLDRIVIMGGAVDVPGNVGASRVGIENAVAEWNLYVDPSAAQVVFQSGAAITLVPLDATNHVPLTARFNDGLRDNHPTPEAAFVFDVLTQKRDFIDSGGYSFWDPLAAALLTDETLATIEDRNLCVVATEGPESGWTRPGEECPQVRVAVSADARRFEQMFVDALNLPSP